MEELLQRYDGAVLVERLAHLAMRSDDEAASEAAFLALRHLDSVSLYSPHLEPLIHKARRLRNRDDETVARLLHYSDPAWGVQLQEHKTEMLRMLNADALYHEKDVAKKQRVAVIYAYSKMYTEANSALSSSAGSSSSCVLAECSAQVGILQGNWMNVSSQDKKIESFMSMCQGSGLYQARVTKDEVLAYWRTKFLIVFAHFLKQNFSQVVIDTNKLLGASPIKTADGELIGCLDVLNASDFHKFVHSDEIRFAIVVSTLLQTTNMQELNEFASNVDFAEMMGPLTMQMFNAFATALNGANFKHVFGMLEEMNDSAEVNCFISKIWMDVKLKFRRRGYLLYLSLVKRVSVEHLSKKLNVEPTRLVRELKELIKAEELQFAFTQNDLILESITTDKKAEYLERLQKLAETNDTWENQLTLKLEKMGGPAPTETQQNPMQLLSGLRSMGKTASSFFGGTTGGL